MDLPKQDVLIHYDEDNGELVFYAVDLDATAFLRRSSFGGIRPTVDELRELGPEEALRRVGGTVLGILDLGSQVKLGITSATTRRSDQDES